MVLGEALEAFVVECEEVMLAVVPGLGSKPPVDAVDARAATASFITGSC